MIKLAMPELIQDLNNGLFVYYDPIFYPKNIANKLYEQLYNEIEYDKNSTVIVYGKKFTIPRKQTAYGDDGMTYKFSGATVHAKPWIPILLRIKKDIENMTAHKFNFCLVN